MYAKVILLSPPFSELTYLLPSYFPEDFWKPGMRVLVPVGGKKKNSLRSAFISAIQEKSELPSSVKFRNIFFPLECAPILSQELVNLSHCLGQRQAFPPGKSYGHVLPANLRSPKARLRWRIEQDHEDLDLHELFNAEPPILEKVAQDLVNGRAYFLLGKLDEAEREIIHLKLDPPWPVRPAAKKQIEILHYIHEHGSQSRRQLLKTFGSTYTQALQKLISSGCLAINIDDPDEMNCLSEIEEPSANFNIKLNPEQNKAFHELLQAFESRQPECRLLFGVTGSGKTAVYMELIGQSLAQGKSVFLLAPEVALAHKLYHDAQNALPASSIYFYHGYQTPARREKIFRELANRKKPCLVIGSRSALFLPLPSLGCVILDEEHDSSFKQDEAFIYHAKEVAWFRISQNNGLMLLASATPDLRTYQAVKQGSLPQSRLIHRISGREMPPMHLIDINPGRAMPTTGEINASSDKILADECEQELLSCLDRGEQAVILLNRRGYAPLIFCVECKHTLRCPHCEIGLAYHKNIDRLVCHYCGYSLAYPTPCPDCGKSNFLPVGEGTEKLEERLESLARQPILRLDRDNVRRSGKMEEILTDFAHQKSPFLVGTQMLSKGHHFPNVTLVIVADGDIGLNIPDYRAAEKTFQLLVQAGGRAGRGEKQGKVLIQTRNRKHYCWEYILNYDYAGFAEAELARRKKNLYPPYINLAMLRLSFPINSLQAPQALDDLGKDLRAKARSSGIIMLGPAPSPIAMLRNQRRYQCLFKCKEWKLARELYFYVQKHPASRYLQISLDLDPVNMM